MAKPKRKSQTYVVNSLGEMASYLALGIITYSAELKEIIPAQVYIVILIIAFSYNKWRRFQTTEPIEKRSKPRSKDDVAAEDNQQ